MPGSFLGAVSRSSCSLSVQTRVSTPTKEDLIFKHPSPSQGGRGVCAGEVGVAKPHHREGQHQPINCMEVTHSADWVQVMQTRRLAG